MTTPAASPPAVRPAIRRTWLPGGADGRALPPNATSRGRSRGYLHRRAASWYRCALALAAPPRRTRSAGVRGSDRPTPATRRPIVRGSVARTTANCAPPPRHIRLGGGASAGPADTPTARPAWPPEPRARQMEYARHRPARTAAAEPSGASAPPPTVPDAGRKATGRRASTAPTTGRGTPPGR